MKRLFLFITVLLFPYLVFAEKWGVVRTNKMEWL
jgi:hypothetical protein